MRNLTLYTLLSLDGVAEEPGNWMFDADEQVFANLATVIRSQDEVLLELFSLDAAAHPVVTMGGHTFVLAARGLHQADNALRVWAVVEALELERERAARALEQFALPGGRGELIQEGAMTILNDSYNANPQSFRAAIA